MVVSDDILSMEKRLNELESSLVEYNAALAEAILQRHQYVYRNAFGMARSVNLFLAFLGAAALSAFAYYVTASFLRSPFPAIVAFAAFFLIFWFAQNGSRRSLASLMEKDEAEFPAFPSWHGPQERIDG